MILRKPQKLTQNINWLKDKDRAFYLAVTEMNNNISQLALMLEQTNAYVDALQQRLEEEISMSFELDGVEKLKGEQGETGDSRTKEEVIELLKPFIPEPIKGEDGRTPIKGVDYFDGVDGKDGESIVGPAGKDGRDGVDGETIVGPKGKDGKDGSPDKPIDIAKKLNTLDGKVKRKVIEGLNDEIARLNKRITEMGRARVGSSRGGGGNLVKYHDLSSQTNNTRTFTVPTHRNALLLVCSDAPHIYRRTTDFTTSGTILTIDSAVPAPSSGSTLVFQYDV